MMQYLSRVNETVVFFESAKRIKSTVSIFAEYLSLNRKVILCREMTKKYEETIRGSLQDLQAKIENDEITLKGEIVMLSTLDLYSFHSVSKKSFDCFKLY